MNNQDDEEPLLLMEKMKQAIWQRRPILGEIMRTHGQMSLYDYTLDFLDVNPTPLIDERKQELIITAEELISRRLGKETGSQVARQLRYLPLVSTADHHAPIDHPFWVNSNIISSLPYFKNRQTKLNYLIVFSFASVSLNNASAFPRGILFHGGLNGSGNYIKLPIMPDKVKMGVVYNTRAITAEDLQRAHDILEQKCKENEITKERTEKIHDILKIFFETPDVLSQTDLTAQFTKINFNLWPKLFHAPQNNNQILGKQTGLKLPDLIYLDIETLVTELLIRYHLKDSSSLIYQLLFNPVYYPLILENFNNIPGSFSLEKDWGTYFFWAFDEKQRRVRLKTDGQNLFSADNAFKLKLTASEIAQALINKKIMPGMLLCYLMVSLYYGIKCLGGFCQVNDLTRTKMAWQNILIKLGNKREAEAIMPLQTRELGGDGMVLAYLKTPKGDFVPATGIDMILKESDTRLYRYLAISKILKMQQIMNPMLPEMYSVLYGSYERDAQLMLLTPEKILNATGLGNQLSELNKDYT